MNQQVMLIVLPVSLLMMMVSLFVYMQLRCRIRHPWERGKQPLVSETFSGVVGRQRFRGPFIGLRLYKDMLVISSIRPWLVPFEDIQAVRICTDYKKKAFCIYHDSNVLPKTMVIFSGNPAADVELIMGVIKDWKMNS